MVSKNEVLDLIRALMTVVIYVFSVVVLGLFSIPFLGSKEFSHRLIVEDGVLSFLVQRLIVFSGITLITFFLLYLLGRLCRKNTSRITYLVVFFTLLGIAVWLAVWFLNEHLWNYVPE